jgi:hypothetical protein
MRPRSFPVRLGFVGTRASFSGEPALKPNLPTPFSKRLPDAPTTRLASCAARRPKRTKGIRPLHPGLSNP